MAVVTRAVVKLEDEAFASPTKPVGRILSAPPTGVPWVRTPEGRGFRRVVASPRPVAVLETEAIRVLLASHHVVAGGGGGVALAPRNGTRQPQAAVIDKDWVAALLAIELHAERLLFVTDVAFAFDSFGDADEQAIQRMTVAEAPATRVGRISPGLDGAEGREPHGLRQINRSIGSDHRRRRARERLCRPCGDDCLPVAIQAFRASLSFAFRPKARISVSSSRSRGLLRFFASRVKLRSTCRSCQRPIASCSFSSQGSTALARGSPRSPASSTR